MPSLRVRYKGAGKVETEIYTLLLPHMVEELRNGHENFVAVSCMPGQLTIESVKTELFNYIKNGLKDNNTKIYFDNVYEGMVQSCVVFIHAAIENLNLNSAHCTFITGAMNAKALYDDWCELNNIVNKINILTLNGWERHMNHSGPQEELNNYELIIEPKEKKFLCFNRIFRFHRVSLLCMLYRENLVKEGFYSFWPDWTHGGSTPPDFNTLKRFISDDLYALVLDEFNKHKHEMPLLLNNNDASNTNYLQHSDLDYYRKSYFSLVTETFFFTNVCDNWDEHAVFFSEKVFKPIMCKHPFILLARPRSLHYLREIGYKTFHPFIDESYDLIENDEERLVAIVNEVKRLSNQSESEWIEWLKNIKDIVNENFNVLKIKKITDHIYNSKIIL